MSRRAAAFVALMLVACGPSLPRWMPAHTGALPRPSVPRALVLDPSDAAALERAGAVFLGNLQIEGDSGAEIEERSGLEAARLGGTHVIAGTDGIIEHRGAYRSASTIRSVSVFSVYYVPRDHWLALPPELRP